MQGIHVLLKCKVVVLEISGLYHKAMNISWSVIPVVVHALCQYSDVVGCFANHRIKHSTVVSFIHMVQL